MNTLFMGTTNRKTKDSSLYESYIGSSSDRVDQSNLQMSEPKLFDRRSRILFLLTFVLLLLLAFVQCFRASHGLHWAYETDFYRDMAFIQGALDGNYGKDPNLAGEYLWYNPLLFMVETLTVWLTRLPVNDIVWQAGPYLNILGPIAFFFILKRIFNIRIALASSLSFLFLASGDIPGWGAATYSPWLFPVCFNQFLFYISVLLCYRAFSRPDLRYFGLLGISIGISFLGHPAPALILILLMFWIQIGNIISSVKDKQLSKVGTYCLQGAVTLIPFILASLPLSYYLIGKYHLHILNRYPQQMVGSIFILHNFKDLIKANFSISALVSLVGLIWFYKNVKIPLVRKIFFGWLFICIFMFYYSSLVASLDLRYNIHLPGTVPSFHYFHYLKALQSVCFGFGFVYLFQLATRFLRNTQWFHRIFPTLVNASGNAGFAGIILLWALIYYPTYVSRPDFRYAFEKISVREINDDKIRTYQFIVKHIPPGSVILCEEGEPSIFPVMPTGRKMVSVGISYSNPYVDFNERETDRNNMISFLRTGSPDSAKSIFRKYNVGFVMLSTRRIEKSAPADPKLGKPVFSNSEYTIFPVEPGSNSD